MLSSCNHVEDHITQIPERPARQTSKWSLWDVVFHENDSLVIKFNKYDFVFRSLMVVILLYTTPGVNMVFSGHFLRKG